MLVSPSREQVKKFKDKKHVGQEMTHLKMLDHPNVVRLLGACTQPPVFCLVMELCQRSMYVAPRP